MLPRHVALLTLLPAQAHDESACPGNDVLLEKGRT
jgi:hypothetical protein